MKRKPTSRENGGSKKMSNLERAKEVGTGEKEENGGKADTRRPIMRKGLWVLRLDQ